MKRVLVLRPEPAASATAERIREHGLDPIVLPLFEVEPVAWEAPDPCGFDGLLLTSANAVRMGGDQLNGLRDLPVHAVGEATAKAAREAAFNIANTGDAGIDRLLESIEPNLRLLHLCGEHRRLPQGARQTIEAIPVYRSNARRGVDVTQAADSVVLVHSQRAGGRFAALVNRAGCERNSIAIAAISNAAAQSTGDGWAQIEIAEAPSEDALLALAARLCNKPAPQ
jgi:uroporphyrinogen-III synthase